MGYVLFEKNGHIALLTINRPEALNALNQEVIHDLSVAVDTAIRDDDIFIVLITGAGKAFVAGADVAVMKDYTVMEAKAFSHYGNGLFLKIEQMKKPVIAAINGFAFGGGCELALACDIRICSERAKLGQPETGLGIIPGFGGTQRLPKLVGRSTAMELIMTGRTIDAYEAREIGLVSRVVPHEDLISTATKLAQDIACQAQVAVQQAKLAIVHGTQCSIENGLAFETEAFGNCFSTEDQKDAMAAFVKKERLKEFKNK